MHQIRTNALAVAIALAFSTGAMAEKMSKDQYQSGKESIAAEYKSARAACEPVAGNAGDICRAKAGGKRKVERAELEVKYRPSTDSRYKLRVARADADYAVAREKCDERAGNGRDVCVKQAKAAAVSAKADAQVKVTTSNAKGEVAGARKDAAAQKRDAAYAVAKEKCDAFAGDTKIKCVDDAKARFGKS